jgi:hypothetical protein
LPVKTAEHTVDSYDVSDFTWKFLTGHAIFEKNDTLLSNLLQLQYESVSMHPYFFGVFALTLDHHTSHAPSKSKK